MGGTAKRHMTQKQRRVYRNIKMEMTSLDQQLKTLRKDYPNKRARDRREKEIHERMDVLEEKMRNHNII